MNITEAAKELARRLGLPYSTVQSLLNCGWTYVEDVNCEPRWVKR